MNSQKSKCTVSWLSSVGVGDLILFCSLVLRIPSVSRNANNYHIVSSIKYIVKLIEKPREGKTEGKSVAAYAKTVFFHLLFVLLFSCWHLERFTVQPSFLIFIFFFFSPLNIHARFQNSEGQNADKLRKLK